MSGHSQAKRCTLVIPARRRSTRLPDKLLLRETGKSVLQHTYEAACQTQHPNLILIATDDDEIATEARRFGAKVVMTSVDCPSGTDRVAEAVREDANDAGIIVNLQGDEPEINPKAIDHLVESLWANPGASMATLATPIRDRRTLDDPACVKVVFDDAGQALYFSRSPIPHPREWDEKMLQATPALFHLHIGIYAYRRDLLLRLATLPTGRLEKLEKLEQLRVLENGERIMVSLVDEPTCGIDTPEEYAGFVARRLAGIVSRSCPHQTQPDRRRPFDRSYSKIVT